ncbi:26S proteasome non-ATPase regulatory subunit 9 [Condylostylus longicornis]|uniref:26S proteasome non-ATPase regulatory subunit 9 n=1 Tax=Condylostylus longicornis TaxID=2530218 RepID=UPI00244DAB75|nr:26S proteasome non-ATPase regulatory subunit 9 [Condylostylus longicornis]
MVVPGSSKKEQTLKLIAEKDKIEQKIKEFGAVLEANGNIGMTGSLIDNEGFPRNDIDVYQVRTARNQIICLQNDLKALMKEIEKGIHEVHAEAAAASSSTSGSTKTIGLNSKEPEDELPLVAICKVDLVFEGSPAEDAGICVGDQIIEFGSANSRNFKKNIAIIAEIVKNKVNERIPIKINRKEQIIETTLTPRTWNGRGLLGCHILPI